MNDPDYVASLEELRKRDEAKGLKAPSGLLISESTPEVRELRELAGRMTRLTNVVLGIAGGRPIQEEPRKYLTAHPAHSIGSDRLAKHKALVARVLPHKAPVAESPTADGAPKEK